MPRRRLINIAQSPNLILSRKHRIRHKSGGTKDAWELQYNELDDFEPWLDAVYLVDSVSDVLLKHHLESISKGVHPGTGRPQPPLDPGGQAAREEGRPPIRSNRGSKSRRRFPDFIRRTKIRSNGKPVKLGTRNGTKIYGTKASCRIEPDPVHKAHVQREADQRRIEYFGAPARLVDRHLKRLVGELLRKPPRRNADEDGKPAKDA